MRDYAGLLLLLLAERLPGVNFAGLAWRVVAVVVLVVRMKMWRERDGEGEDVWVCAWEILMNFDDC